MHHFSIITVPTLIIFTMFLKLVSSASLVQDMNQFNVINPETGKEFNLQLVDAKAPISRQCTPTDTAPDPKSQCCGITAGRIEPVVVSTVPRKTRSVGGEGTSLEQYPWLALLEPKKDSGFLISGRYVVTAAATLLDGYVVKKPTAVRLGDYNKENEGPDCTILPNGDKICTDGAIRIAVDGVIIHPKYNETLNRNDIGLIRLKKLAPFTKFIRPICLPSKDITEKPRRNLRLDFVGWGVVAQYYNPLTKYYKDVDVPDRLRVELPYKTIEECTKLWKWPLWNKHICAGGEGKSPCHGDSGGPLMYRNGDVMEVVGLSTRSAIPCGHNNGPGIFTNIYKYKAWIQSQTELMSEE